MPGALMYGWDDTNKEWAKLLVDPDGSIHIVGYVDSLDDIGDVNVPSPTDAYVLYWDATAGKWQCKAIAPDAVAAMGAKANENPLNHDRYTDALAVTAAKTVKLDDFTAPDAGTDLDASNARHGLLKQLIDDTTKFLRSDGGWQVPAGGGPTIVRKTADQTVNNSIDLVNDSHLLFALAANEIWLIEIFLLGLTNGDAEFNFGFSGPTGTTFSWRFMGKDAANTMVDNNYFTIDSTQTVWGLGEVFRVQVKGIAICSSTAGNLRLIWAQNVATVVDTKVLTNSCIIAHRIA